jgi:protein-S-isoprenylcysteine O-methyltransferase Ste14
MKSKDNPGVYIPPPMIYAFVFGMASIAESVRPIHLEFFKSTKFHFTGWIFLIIAIGILVLSVGKFLFTKNTLITIRSANTLQTNGIYAITRNPMYLSLLVLYISFACFSENCWTFIFTPALIIIIQYYVILREEKYLERAFPEEYKIYKRNVRRWI